MIVNKNPLKFVGIIGVCTISGIALAIGCKVKDWRWISTAGSIGCALGVGYLNYTRQLNS